MVRLAGRQVELVASLRAMLAFEEVLGFALHATMGRNPAKVARALLWAMATAAGNGPSLVEIGQAPLVEIDQALGVAAGLLRAGEPILDDYDIEAAAAVTDRRSRTDWMELWATGRRDLRLSEEELWACSPAMYWALLKRYEAEQEHFELCAGITAAATQECHRDPDKADTPIDPWLFVMRGKTAAERRKKAEAELVKPNPNLKAKLKAFFRTPKLLQDAAAKRKRGAPG